MKKTMLAAAWSLVFCVMASAYPAQALVRYGDLAAYRPTGQVMGASTNENYDSGKGVLTMTSPRTDQVLKGTINWSVNATVKGPFNSQQIAAMRNNRGCSDAEINSGVCAVETVLFFIDGHIYKLFEGNSHTLDTTTLTNGSHELFMASYNMFDDYRPVAARQHFITVDNGRTPRAIRAGYGELILAPGQRQNLSPKLIYTNGDEEALTGGVSYRSGNSGVASVSASGEVRGVSSGVTTVTVTAQGKSANVRVIVDNPVGFPHFSKDGSILYQYDPARSIFIRSMFNLGPEEIAGTPGLAAASKAAAINTLTSGFYVNPIYGGNPNLASWKTGYDHHWNNDILGPARDNDFYLWLTGDDMTRHPDELNNSINNSWSTDAIRHALNAAKNSKRAVAIDMVDEVNIMWGDTPTPTDGRWGSTPNNAFTRLMNIVNGAQSPRLPITWPTAGLSGAIDWENWMGDVKFSDFATHFYDVLDWRLAYPRGNRSLPQVRQYMGEEAMYGRLPYIQRGKPQMTMVSSTGPFYTKMVSGGQYVEGRDILQAPATRPIAVMGQIMYAAAAGMSGIRMYAYDTRHDKSRRVSQGIDEIDTQTGTDPFTVGADRWDAMSKSFNFIKSLEPVLMQQQISAVDMGPNIATAARRGSNGTMLMAINMSEADDRIAADLTPYANSGTMTRYRLTLSGWSTENVPVAPSDKLQIKSGETIVWVFSSTVPPVVMPTPPTPPTVNQKPEGYLDGVNSDGIVSGWSHDTDDLSSPVSIHLYFDKNAGTSGASPIPITANQNRSDVGSHAFDYSIPSSLRDGKQHQVWAWALDLTDTTGASNIQLIGSPKSFTLGQITPPAPINQAPIVSAGIDQAITLPASVSLAGTASDDNLPAGNTLTITWSKVSGPGTVVFTNTSLSNTTASFSASGTYTLRLTGSDGTLSSSDNVVITVQPQAMQVNQAPIVNAGADQVITLPNSITLSGTVTDDGMPVDGTITASWSKVSGPGSVTFGSSYYKTTTAVFSTAGVYTLSLTGSDGFLSASDNVIVTVNAQVQQPGNFPTVSAGEDREITLPEPIELFGSINYNGLPKESVKTTWSQVSGPGTATFDNPSNSIVMVSFTAAGLYTMQFSAAYGGVTASDTLLVNVKRGSTVTNPSTPPSEPSESGMWTGEYYTFVGDTQFGRHITTRQDAVINFNWGTGRPHPSLPAEKFAIRWNGEFDFPETATYSFTVTADDGVRVFIDDSRVLNKWFDQGVTTYTFNKNLTAGKHTVKVEYYERGGIAAVSVNWKKKGSVAGVTTVEITHNLSKGYGTNSPEVFVLQQYLYDHGYLTIAPTGFFGKDTEAAVKRLQKDFGIKQTGVVGKLTSTVINRDK